MKNIARSTTVLLLAALLLTLLIQVAPASKSRAKRQRKLNGSIAAVGRNYVKVVPKRKGAKVKIFIGAQSRIKLENRRAGLDELDLDDRVTVGYRLKDDRRVASSIRAMGEFEAEGSVAAIDVTAGTIAILDRETSETVELLTDGDTIFESDSWLTLADLELGDQVEAHFRQDGDLFIATKIEDESDDDSHHSGDDDGRDWSDHDDDDDDHEDDDQDDD